MSVYVCMCVCVFVCLCVCVFVCSRFFYYFFHRLVPRGMTNLTRWHPELCSFRERAAAVVAALHPVRCTRRRQIQIGFGPSAAIVCMVVTLLLFFLLRSRRLKPKVN